MNEQSDSGYTKMMRPSRALHIFAHMLKHRRNLLESTMPEWKRHQITGEMRAIELARHIIGSMV